MQIPFKFDLYSWRNPLETAIAKYPIKEGRHQAITWTSVDFSSVKSSGIHLRAIS